MKWRRMVLAVVNTIYASSAVCVSCNTDISALLPPSGLKSLYHNPPPPAVTCPSPISPLPSPSPMPCKELLKFIKVKIRGHCVLNKLLLFGWDDCRITESKAHLCDKHDEAFLLVDTGQSHHRRKPEICFCFQHKHSLLLSQHTERQACHKFLKRQKKLMVMVKNEILVIKKYLFPCASIHRD